MVAKGKTEEQRLLINKYPSKNILKLELTVLLKWCK